MGIGIMVYSRKWVMQDLYHPSYCLNSISTCPMGSGVVAGLVERAPFFLRVPYSNNNIKK